jgi:hypothetical protein
MSQIVRVIGGHVTVCSTGDRRVRLSTQTDLRAAQVGPVQLPARYHAGVFSAASQAAAVTIAGSCGCR